MQEDVITRLDFTLNDEEVLIPLRMKSFGERSGKASLKLRRKLKTAEQVEQDLDLNEAIVQVFCRSDVRKKLLILGAPGAGKTTTLLTLAKDLLAGAIDNPGTVIPIVFELSTWKTGTIENWLAAQLKESFNLSIAEGQEWIKDEILLPLMDGLDELSLEQQQKCMAELNAFAGRYPHLVVCCRVQEYVDARVGLNAIAGQICLEPLNNKQIKRYLQDIELESLWDEILRSADMRRMLRRDEDGNPGILRVPLLLSIAAEAYDGKPFASRSELYEAYVEKRLMRETRRIEREFKRDQKEQWAYESVEAEPKFKETRSSLAWAARQLQTQQQVELLIERIQPTWLESPQLCYRYQLILALITGLAFALVIGLSSALINGLIYGVNGLIYGLIGGLVYGLIGGLIFGMVVKHQEITTTEAFHIITLQKIPGKMLNTLWKLTLCNPIDLVFLTLIVLLIETLQNLSGKVLIAARRIEGNRESDSAETLEPTKSQLRYKGNIKSSLWRIFQSSLGISRSLVKIFQVLLQMILLTLYRCFLILPIELVCVTMDALLTWSKQSRERVEQTREIVKLSQQGTQLRANPNQGIWNSMTNAFWTALFMYPLTLALLYILQELIRQLAESINVRELSLPTLSNLLLNGLQMSLVWGLIFGGGLVCLQHICLRFILWQSGTAPWKFAQFLNYCTERRLLQRIGGRYRFLHRELLDHFAMQSNNKV
ncbi:NACHT domain-containing protein [Leptolyngbya sp. AN03gr2]|uniref:NACHT domain-containing protein n=1 Tax=unclassified Leptolyngbya TaxID=2650499 RepID=UPI003D31B08B